MNIGNSQFERDFESFLNGDDVQLEALYRKLPQPEPDARLDASVQAMARRTVAASARIRVVSQRRWLPAFAAAAVIVIAAGIAIRLGPQMWKRPANQSEAEPVTVPAAPPPTAVASSAQKASAAPAVTTAPAAQVPAAEMKKVENASSRPAPRAFPAPARAMRESLQRPAAPEAKPALPAPAMAAPMPASQPETESAGAPVQALAAPAALDSNASLYPEHWLANIRQMLRDNRREEALRSIAEFRKRYPDYHLPDDLRDLH